MNRDDLLNAINQIGTCEDDNARRTMLTTLTENVGKVFDEVDLLKQGTESLQNTIKTKDEELQTAQKYNMELFLKVQDQTKNDNSTLERETGIQKEKEI